MFLRYKNAAFILSHSCQFDRKQQVSDSCQVKLRTADYAPDIALWHHTLPSAGYQRDTPLAANRWHGSPVGLSTSAVLAGFSTVRHLSPVVADEATIFRSPSILRLARAHLVGRSSPIFGLILVEELRLHPVPEGGTGRKGALEAEPPRPRPGETRRSASNGDEEEGRKEGRRGS